jgi:hypothetical protein
LYSFRHAVIFRSASNNPDDGLILRTANPATNAETAFLRTAKMSFPLQVEALENATRRIEQDDIGLWVMYCLRIERDQVGVDLHRLQRPGRREVTLAVIHSEAWSFV